MENISGAFMGNYHSVFRILTACIPGLYPPSSNDEPASSAYSVEQNGKNSGGGHHPSHPLDRSRQVLFVCELFFLAILANYHFFDLSKNGKTK
jgi:hypothetical protein